jgi:hypothetical protein
MTQAYNLSQLANNLTSSGLLDAADGLVNAVPVANGGTGATSASAARTNLGLVIGTNIPSPIGTGASGTWAINVTGSSGSCTGNAATATTAGTASNLASGTTINPLQVYSAQWIWANTGGTGGDAAVRLYSGSSIGVIEAISLDGSTPRWLRINPSDRIVMGNGNPELNSKLTVQGRIFCEESSAGGTNGYAMVNQDGRIGQFNVGDNYIEVQIDNNNYGINIFLSDANVKKNITPVDYDALNKINKIAFVEYDYDEDKAFKTGHIDCGVTSQQLETIESTWVENQGDFLNPKIDVLLYAAMRSIQQLSDKVNALQSQVIDLQKQVEEETTIAKGLQEKYGDGNIDLEKGEFIPVS